VSKQAVNLARFGLSSKSNNLLLPGHPLAYQAQNFGNQRLLIQWVTRARIWGTRVPVLGNATAHLDVLSAAIWSG